MSFFKLAATAVVTGATAVPAAEALAFTFQLPVLPAPVLVAGAAAFGAGLSLFFGDPIPSRRSLYGQTLAAAAFGYAGAVLSADAFQWAWAQRNMAMFAMVAAAVLRWWLPSVIERGKVLIHEFRFPTTKKKTPPGDQP